MSCLPGVSLTPPPSASPCSALTAVISRLKEQTKQTNFRWWNSGQKMSGSVECVYTELPRGVDKVWNINYLIVICQLEQNSLPPLAWKHARHTWGKLGIHKATEQIINHKNDFEEFDWFVDGIEDFQYQSMSSHCNMSFFIPKLNLSPAWRCHVLSTLTCQQLFMTPLLNINYPDE